MRIEEFVTKTQTINPHRNYWFVRTDSGVHFDTFYENDFIGIGWNYITINDLINKSAQEVKTIIAQREGFDFNLAKGRSSAGSVYNKLIAFKDLKKGDLIIIPSHSSHRLAFGIVDDSKVFSNIEDSHHCSYHKRRKINWLLNERLDALDPMFYQVRITRHTISKINKYDSYIDNITNSLYFKDGSAHFVVDVKTKDEINLKSLIKFIDNVQDLTEKINSYYNFNENVEQASIKLNLQSPGLIDFKLPIGRTLIVLATIITFASCNKTFDNNSDLKPFVEANTEILDTIQQNMNDLEIDREKINSIF